MNNTIKIVEIDEESKRILINNTQVAYITYDNVGWDGMETVEEVVRNIASVLGIQVIECYEPDDEDFNS